MSLTETGGMSPADLGAIMGNDKDFDGSWWIIILFLFIFCGLGGNWGNNGANTTGALDNYVLASDFATLQRQLDSATDRLATQGTQITNGISSLGYDQLAQMNTLGQSIANNGHETRNAITQAQINAMSSANALQTQIANASYANSSAIADVNYNMLSNANNLNNTITSGLCQTNYNNQSNTRDIVDNQNANTQSILAAINQMNIDNKDAKIAEQAQQISALQLAASQQAQNNYIVSQLKMSPVPAFNVPNPYTYTGCGCNS